MKRFKVWDIENKRFINPRQCLIDGNGNFFYKDDDNGQLYNWTEDFKIYWCSGKSDINERPIYDGDIIKFSSHWDNHIATVQFIDGAFRFGEQVKGDLGINDDSCIFDFLVGAGGDDEFEIIGNVRENPELLKS